MTLDEAIKHAEEVAEQQDYLAEREDRASGYTRTHNESIRTEGAKKCLKCASDHRQLAEWLRQLSEIRHLFNVTEKIWKHNCVGKFITLQEGYDILFSEHKQLREIFEEVANASDTM